MNIFLVYHPSGNSSVPGSETWRRNLYEPLLDLGHTVYELRMDTILSEKNLKRKTPEAKALMSEEVLSRFTEAHSKKHVDFFLSYFNDNEIEASVIDEIKKQGVPTANFSCNNTHQFNLTENIAPHFDYNLHSEKDAGEKFKAIGANAIWFQMAANPKYFKPQGLPFEYEVSFIGAAYAKRAYYIEKLLDNGVNVDCFGPNWLINRPHSGLKKIVKELKREYSLLRSLICLSAKRRYSLINNIADYDRLVYLRKAYPQAMHYPVSDEQMIKIFNQSRINLGFLEVFIQSKTGRNMRRHLHLREFEVPMCGALYITNYSEELAEHYEPDNEVLVYHSEYELIDKVQFYLSNESAAEEVRKAGHKRALACHTYQKRYTDLFPRLGFS